MSTSQDIIARLGSSGRFEVGIDDSLGYPLKVFTNAPRSLRDFLEQCTPPFADRVFLVYGDEEITFGQFRTKVAAMANFLVGLGIGKGDRVAIGMRNYPEWVISFWACHAIGAVVVALNAWWVTLEFEYALQNSEPKLVILDDERCQRIMPLLAQFPGIGGIAVRMRDVPAGWHDFADVVAAADAPLPPATIDPLDPATILYTSGTTGRPKGAVGNQRNHVMNAWSTLMVNAAAMELRGVDAAQMPQNSVLQTYPYFHISGISQLCQCIATGAKVVLMYKWDPAEAVTLIEKYQIRTVIAVPFVVRQLLDAALAMGAGLDTLTGLSAGGAAVPGDLIKRIQTQLKAKVVPGNGYGLTETTASVISNKGADYIANPDSVGRPGATSEIRIVDSEGQDVAQGDVGELWVRGPNVIPGYWRDPAATEAAFGGGWFRTGDLGYADAEGRYYIADRKKDMIIRGGENVYCAEVETALLAHPRVTDATVIGVPHEELGEEVTAVIQPNGDFAGLEAALKIDLAGKLAKFKIPTVFHFIAEDLPRNASGKVIKTELRDRFGARPVAAR